MVDQPIQMAAGTVTRPTYYADPKVELLIAAAKLALEALRKGDIWTDEMIEGAEIPLPNCYLSDMARKGLTLALEDIGALPKPKTPTEVPSVEEYDPFGD